MTNLNFNKSIKIGNKNISQDDKVFIIAEAGVNHCGDMDMASKMIAVAAEAGADAIKFQSFKADSLILDEVEMADYQKTAIGSNKTQHQMLKELEMDVQSMEVLKKISEKMGLIFLTTPFDEDSLEELKDLDLDAYKISSTDTTNISFVKNIARLNKPIIISTGMTYMKEIEVLIEEIHGINHNIILLQCTSDYPLKEDEVNMKVMEVFKNKFNCLVGFSDHTSGQLSGVVAASLGAAVIEKHFTLDKKLDGPDHAASLDPHELTEFVKSIRRVSTILGSSIKKPTISEGKTRVSLQKSIVAKKNIKKGDIFTYKNLGTKRAGGKGISAFEIEDLVDKISNNNFSMNDIINR